MRVALDEGRVLPGCGTRLFFILIFGLAQQLWCVEMASERSDERESCFTCIGPSDNPEWNGWLNSTYREGNGVTSSRRQRGPGPQPSQVPGWDLSPTAASTRLLAVQEPGAKEERGQGRQGLSGGCNLCRSRAEAACVQGTSQTPRLRRSSGPEL